MAFPSAFTAPSTTSLFTFCAGSSVSFQREIRFPDAEASRASFLENANPLIGEF